MDDHTQVQVQLTSDSYEVSRTDCYTLPLGHNTLCHLYIMCTPPPLQKPSCHVLKHTCILLMYHYFLLSLLHNKIQLIIAMVFHSCHWWYIYEFNLSFHWPNEISSYCLLANMLTWPNWSAVFHSYFTAVILNSPVCCCYCCFTPSTFHQCAQQQLQQFTTSLITINSMYLQWISQTHLSFWCTRIGCLQGKFKWCKGGKFWRSKVPWKCALH